MQTQVLLSANFSRLARATFNDLQTRRIWATKTLRLCAALAGMFLGEKLFSATAVVDPGKPSVRLEESIKQANELWLKGDAPKAIPLYESLLPEAEKVYGTESRIKGLVLFRIGFLYLGKGQFEKGIAFLEKSLGILNQFPDDDDNLLTKANLNWGLGLSYKSLLKTDQATKSFKQALAQREKLSGADNPALINILTELANIHLSLQNRPAEAVPLLERALAISEITFGKESVETANALASLGNCKDEAGDFVAALTFLKRSLEIRERTPTSKPQDIAAAFQNLGIFYSKYGDYTNGLHLIEKCIAIMDNNPVIGDLQFDFDLASALSNLGVTLSESGDPQKAITALRRSLAVTESAFGGSSINLVKVLNALAVTYHHLGDFKSALPLLEKAIRILENAPPHTAGELADTLNNIAELIRDAGDHAEANRFFTRSIEIAERHLGPTYISIGYSLNGLALIAEERGKTTLALEHFKRAAAVMEKNLGPRHAAVGGLLNNIASFEERTGDVTSAIKTLRRALDIQERAFPNGHPDTAISLSNLGYLQQRTGKFTDARNLFKRSLEMTEAVLGHENLQSSVQLENLAVAELAAGETKNGFANLVEAARRMRQYASSQLTPQESIGNSRIKTALWKSRDWIHSICPLVRDDLAWTARTSCAEHLIMGKALLEEVEATAASVSADNRVQIQDLKGRSVTIRRRLDSLSRPKSNSDWINERSAWRNSERDKLEQELSSLEKQMALSSARIAQNIRDRNLTLSDISNVLPRDAVLVDFVYFQRKELMTKGPIQPKEFRYAAYLTLPRPKGQTNVVLYADLGDAAPIDEAIAQLHQLLSDKRIAPSRLGPVLARLSGLVYAPLKTYLTNIPHVIICPDGELGRLPFEMLPVGTAGSYLLENKRISYVSSGREIVRLATPKPSVPTSAPLVMGFPDFDLRLAAKTEPVAGPITRPDFSAPVVAVRAPVTLSRETPKQRFVPLPETEREARTAAKLLSEKCLLRLGADAREVELKRIESPRIIHLATHGFYLPDQEVRATNRVNDLLTSSFASRFSKRDSDDDWENPMVRCGLALAGANHFESVTNAVIEDGILTGLEASLLNLQGTDLVILSACQTSSGDVRIGEGVMSLRRAFTIAGAQSVLASHWRVSDAATSQLVTEFLKEWRTGKQRSAAMREAQLSLLRSQEFSNPYFWAAFTLTGRWD